MTTSTPTRAIGQQPTRWDPKLVEMVNDVFFDILMPRAVRTMLEFAEQEIILPDGPCSGKYFRADRMPFLGEILEMFDSGRFNRFFGQGPRQTAKTLAFFQIPLMYHLFELEQDVIIGVPRVELAKQIWERRIKKMIEKSRYAHLMPEKGPGSKGGKPQQITFGNGATLIFMSKGHTHTAPVLILTELYQMQESAEKSDEPSPWKQLEKCTTAFGGSKRIYAESIVTIEGAGCWKEVEGGTASRVYFRCPKCKKYVEPLRVQFRGWTDAKTDMEASQKSYYQCQACNKKWTKEEDHIKASQNYKLVHDLHPWEMKKDGEEYEGILKGKPKPIPNTYTMGITWNRMHTTLRPKKSPYSVMGEIGIEEFNAARSEDPDDEEAVSMYIWTEPVQTIISQDRSITTEMIQNKISKHINCEIPENAQTIVSFVDIGETVHWFKTMAFNKETAAGHVIDYDSIPVDRDNKETAIAIYDALVWIRENHFKRGYKVEGSKNIVYPEVVLIDSGYGEYADVIYRFCVDSGVGYYPTKGCGSGPRMPNWSDQDPTEHLIPGNNWRQAYLKDKGIWLLEYHTDYWKTRFQDRLLAAPNTPGSIYIYRETPQHHMQLIRHYTAERRKTVPGRGETGGLKTIWTYPGSKPNHWWDCGVGCIMGADYMGIQTMPNQPVPMQEPEYRQQNQKTWINRGKKSWIRGRR